MTVLTRHVDIWSLDVFVSVVELGSISRASTAHGLSQPAVSNRIANLERLLGVRLLERGASGSQPTEDGQIICDLSRSALHATARLLAVSDGLRARRGHHLRLAASFTVAEFLLPRWLQSFFATRPAVTATVDVANSRRVVERLLSAEVDLGFVEGRGGTEDLPSTVVAEDELVVVVPPRHPWLRRRSISPGELASTALVVRETGSGTRETLETALQLVGHGDRADPLVELGSTAAVKQAVADGVGPAVLSSLTIRAEVQAEQLHTVEVVDLDLCRELRAVWIGGTPPDLAASLLRHIAPGPSGPGSS